MNILVIPNEPNPNMTGRHYFVACALAARGHQVHELIWDLPLQMGKRQLLRHLFTSLRTGEYKYQDLTMHCIARLPLYWPHINGWLFRWQVRRLHRSLGIDMIVAQGYSNETTMPKDLPFIYDLADDYAAPGDIYGSPIYKLAFRVLGVRRTMRMQCQRAVAVTAVSDILCRYARQYSNHVSEVPNGVDTDVIQAVAKATTGTPHNKHSIVYVTGFGPWSRPVETMQTVLDLRKKFPDIDLTLAGEGSEVPKIKQFITDHNAGDFIHYAGFIRDRKELFTLVANSAIGLNISEKNKWRDAAQPLKVLEYSALGKKVVSTDLEGVKALNFPNVFMFSDSSKKDSFKEVLERVLLDKTPEAAYQTVRNTVLTDYSWKTVIDRLLGTIQDAQEHVALPQVVHVTSSYPPTLGGLEQVVQNLAAAQLERGITPRVITATPVRHTGAYSASPFVVQRLRSFEFATTTIMPGLLWQLLKIRKDTMVHLHVTQAFTPEMVWLASKIKGFRYVAHIHIDAPPTTRLGFLLKVYKPCVLKYVLRAASFVVVFTQDQRAEMHQQYGIAMDRLRALPNGVEQKFYRDRPRTLHAKPRLVFVGRLQIQKNLQMLLRALDGVSEQFQTTLVGDGIQAAELKALAKDLKLQNVTFAGRADGAKLHQYYQDADVFVLPSEREGMPLVLLEAMAMGLPIVATNVTGNRDVVQDGKNGYLVPLDDIAAFRKALQKATASQTAYIRLSQQSRTLSNQYSWPTIAAQFDELYKESHA